MNKKIIVALFGAAGSGKDSLQKEIAKQSPFLFHEIISSTTRPAREYETDGIDYHFITDEQSKTYRKNKEYLEYAEFRGWCYGTLKDSVVNKKINIGVFNISGVKQLLELSKEEYQIIPVFIYCSDKERLLRQLNREENPDCEEICRRFKTDKEDFAYNNMKFWHLSISNEYEEISAIANDLLITIYHILAVEYIRGDAIRAE